MKWYKLCKPSLARTSAPRSCEEMSSKFHHELRTGVVRSRDRGVGAVESGAGGGWALTTVGGRIKQEEQNHSVAEAGAPLTSADSLPAFTFRVCSCWVIWQGQGVMQHFIRLRRWLRHRDKKIKGELNDRKTFIAYATRTHHRQRYLFLDTYQNDRLD